MHQDHTTLQIEVEGSQIIVTMLGTSFRTTYSIVAEAPTLMQCQAMAHDSNAGISRGESRPQLGGLPITRHANSAAFYLKAWGDAKQGPEAMRHSARRYLQAPGPEDNPQTRLEKEKPRRSGAK